MRIFARTALLLGLLSVSAAAEDSFDKIKARLGQSDCISIEFLSVLESDIFDRTDTTRGTALLAGDGRYKVTVGEDQYLMTGDTLYSYSKQNNQVVVEKVDSGKGVSSEVTYIRRLDDWFKTRILKPDREYFLVRTRPEGGSIPDSMTVYVNKKEQRISRIAYYDINDELVTLVFVKEKHSDGCDEAQLRPDFPKSAERVKL